MPSPRTEPGLEARRAAANRDAPGTPRARSKRERILEAARRVAAHHGFDATRMEQIATEAGVSKGTLYNFFSSKEDLLVESVLHTYQTSIEVFPQVGDESAPALDRLQALIESLAGGFEAASRELLLAQQAWGVVLRAPEARERLRSALREIYAGWGREIELILAAGIEQGVFRADIDRALASSTFIATFDGLLHRAGFADPEQPGTCSTEGVRRSLEWLTRTLLERPQSDPSCSAPPNDAPPQHAEPKVRP
jgi:AcrR family transcriptional regulator